MYTKSNALANYGKVANAESDPIQQLVMLYDGAIKFLRLAAADLEKQDLIAKAEHVNRALDILNYLQGILDFAKGGTVAEELDRFYTVVSIKALRASAAIDAAAFLTAAEMLVPVRDSWAQASSTVPECSATVLTETPAARIGHLVFA